MTKYTEPPSIHQFTFMFSNDKSRLTWIDQYSFKSCLMNTGLNVSSSQDQKSWTLYKMYWRLANGILMGTQRSKSRGVYGGGGPNE